MKGRLVLAAVLAATLLGACGGEDPAPRGEDTAPTTTSTSTSEEGPPDSVVPPPLVVEGDAGEVEVAAWGYCWSSEGTGVCIDGMPPDEPVSVGSPGTVTITFPADGWTFDATFLRGDRQGDGCAARVKRTGERTFVIEPAGPAGDFVVDLFGRGPEGDASATFSWTLTEPGAPCATR